MSEQKAKKRIYNPVTGKYYEAKQRSSKYKKPGQIKSLWSQKEGGKKMKEQNVEKIAWSDITLGAACALLERFGGWFDGDEMAVIVLLEKGGEK